MTVLVLDVGSSSVRAVLFDEAVRPLPGGMIQRHYQMQRLPDGAAVFEMTTLQAHIEGCITEILAHPAASTIQAVGMATFAGNLMGIDAYDQPLTPLFTYADTRAQHDLEVLRPVYEASDTHQRTGCPHHTAYFPSLLAWLRRTDPDLYESVQQWTDLGSYLYRQWFGRVAPTSYSCASWTGLFNRYTLQWDATWLAALHLPPENLSPLADFDAPMVGLSSAYGTRWPQVADTPFFLAIGDGAAANVGVGALDENSIALTIGTTAAIRMMTAESMPTIPDGLWGYRVDVDHHLIGGATNEGGNIYQWLSDILQVPDDADRQILAQRGKDHGLTFVPLLAGERSPGWNPLATGSIQGLRLSTTAIDIVQAGLEGIAARLALIIHQLPNADRATIYASGGALSASMAWTAIIADALGCDIQRIDFSETTARGCACLLLSRLHARPLSDFPMLPTQKILPK